MHTLTKHFKGHEGIRAGTFITNQQNGRLYVLGSNGREAYLTDILWGCQYKGVIHPMDHDILDEAEMMYLIIDVSRQLEVNPAFHMWHKLSDQEVIGKFASLILK